MKQNLRSSRKRRYKKYLILRYGEHCQFCKQKEKLTLDHIVPKSRGGSDDLKNMMLLCESCNNMKGFLTMCSFLCKLDDIKNHLKNRKNSEK